jgi:hypothetical protein
MAISDFFSGGQTPDYLSGLLDDEQLRKLKESAQQNAMMQFGLSALANSGYSKVPVGLGEILGQAGQAGMQGYQKGIQGGIEGIGTRAKLEELQRKKQDEAKRQAYMQQYASTLPANQQAAVQAMPELGVKLAENQFMPKTPKYEKLGNQLIDVSGTPTVAFTGTPEAPSMTEEPNRVAFAKFGKPINQLTPPQVNEVNQYIEQSKVRVAGAGIPSQAPSFKDATSLRQEYQSMPAVKYYGEMKNAFDQIKTGLAATSPAGDLTAATKFMKLLDPGSVVRESELGMAMAATGLLDRATNYFNLLSSGQKLSPTQRKDFLNVSTKLFNAAKNTKSSIENQYKFISKKGGLDPDLVIGNAFTRTEADILNEYGVR